MYSHSLLEDLQKTIKCCLVSRTDNRTLRKRLLSNVILRDFTSLQPVIWLHYTQTKNVHEGCVENIGKLNYSSVDLLHIIFSANLCLVTTYLEITYFLSAKLFVFFLFCFFVIQVQQNMWEQTESPRMKVTKCRNGKKTFKLVLNVTFQKVVIQQYLL